MDARTNIKARLPGRHVTEGPERASHSEQVIGLLDLQARGIVIRWSLENAAASSGSTNAALHLPAIAYECRIKLDRRDVTQIFKKTPYIADLKPSGRYVAKDMFEAEAVPLLMKTLLDQGDLHGDCMTVTGRTIAENMASVKENPHQDVMRAADKPITVTYAVVGLQRDLARAATHPGGAEEKQCYADI